MEEIKIGEVFEFEGKKVVVKEYVGIDGCKGCIGILGYESEICDIYKCMIEEREDNKSVIFVGIKED